MSAINRFSVLADCQDKNNDTINKYNKEFDHLYDDDQYDYNDLSYNLNKIGKQKKFLNNSLSDMNKNSLLGNEKKKIIKIIHPKPLNQVL